MPTIIIKRQALSKQRIQPIILIEKEKSRAFFAKKLGRSL